MKVEGKELVFITKEDYEEKKLKGTLDSEVRYFTSENPRKDSLNCDMRVPQLKAMHSFICNANDENITMSWLSLGVPDGADIYDYISIARDEQMYKDICDLFQRLVAKNGWRF